MTATISTPPHIKGIPMLRSATFVCLAFGVGLLSAAEPSAKKTSDNFFGLTKLHQFQLSVDAKDYPKMDPPQKGGMFGGKGPAMPKFGPDFGAGSFGYEFEYVHADFQAGDRTFKNVGVRYKGNGTYLMSARMAKRSFKVDFDRFDNNLAIDDLKKLNLNSGVMDPTKAREALAYAVFRAAGVPASRTAFAEVTLTVPGKYDQELLGLYTIVEQVDKGFLKTHFGNSKGLLLKPEGIRGVPHLGDDPKAYEKPYNAKNSGDEAEWKRLIEFTRLVNKADDAEFRKQISAYLDIDNFVRFLAANTLLSSLDGFIGLGHNYYLYLSPKTNKFAFIPWDLDLSFGAFAIYGSTEQLADLSIDHPHLGENKLIDRLLAMPEVKTAYRAQIRKLAEEVFIGDKLGKDINAIDTAIKDLIVKDRKAAEARKETGGGFGFGQPFGGQSMTLTAFMEKRSASVTAQLAGKSKGYVPAMSFGPPGGFGPGSQLAKPLLDALDTNKDGKVSEEEMAEGMKRLFKQWDKDGNGLLDQKEIADGLQRLPK